VIGSIAGLAALFALYYTFRTINVIASEASDKFNQELQSKKQKLFKLSFNYQKAYFMMIALCFFDIVAVAIVPELLNNLSITGLMIGLIIVPFAASLILPHLEKKN